MSAVITGVKWVGIGFGAALFGLSVGHGIRIERERNE